MIYGCSQLVKKGGLKLNPPDLPFLWYHDRDQPKKGELLPKRGWWASACQN